MIFGSRAFGRWLGLEEIMKATPHNEISFLIGRGRGTRACSFSAMWGHVGRLFSASQGTNSHQEPNLPVPRTGASQPPELPETNVCCPSCPGSCISLKQPSTLRQLPSQSARTVAFHCPFRHRGHGAPQDHQSQSPALVLSDFCKACPWVSK